MPTEEPERRESEQSVPARLDQIINIKHELVQLAGKIDWEWIDGEVAPLYNENGRPGIETRFMDRVEFPFKCEKAGGYALGSVVACVVL